MWHGTPVDINVQKTKLKYFNRFRMLKVYQIRLTCLEKRFEKVKLIKAQAGI